MPDQQYGLNGVTFVWNEDKARLNPLTHEGVTFEQAAEVFFDPFLRVVDASRSHESRDKVIGRDARSRLLAVVHVEWHDEFIRLISAWPATPEEREIYDS